MSLYVRDIYHVDTDIADWPTSFPKEERVALIELVRPLIATGKYTTYQMERILSRKQNNDVPVFNRAAVMDWRLACVERACRAADARLVWAKE